MRNEKNYLSIIIKYPLLSRALILLGNLKEVLISIGKCMADLELYYEITDYYFVIVSPSLVVDSVVFLLLEIIIIDPLFFVYLSILKLFAFCHA